VTQVHALMLQNGVRMTRLQVRSIFVRKLAAVLLYGAAALSLLGWIDGVLQGQPAPSYVFSWRLTQGAADALAVACLLCMFSHRYGVMLAALSLAYFMPLAAGSPLVFGSVVVAAMYSAAELWAYSREESSRITLVRTLQAALIYGVAAAALALWVDALLQRFVLQEGYNPPVPLPPWHLFSWMDGAIIIMAAACVLCIFNRRYGVMLGSLGAALSLTWVAPALLVYLSHKSGFGFNTLYRHYPWSTLFAIASLLLAAAYPVRELRA
jgi:hypothetical protein